jgi:hypothetical protein
MRQMEDLKLRQRQSLTLHVENIGRPMESEQMLRANRGMPTEPSLSKKSFKESGFVLQEQLSLTKYTRQSLQKVKSRQVVGLPIIMDSKVSARK